MIQLIELRRWGVYAIFGIGMWLIYQGVFNFLAELGWSASQSIAWGVVIVLSMLFMFKFKGIGW